MFIDSASVTVRAGRGGNGCVSFRREKFVPKGGPNGGDGGRGGNVILRVDPSFNTLLHVHHRRLVRAENGSHGQGSNKTGAGGADVTIAVPPGTLVFDAETRETLGDLVEMNHELVVVHGGRGGRGNARFKSSTNRTPRRADPGQPGEEKTLLLELKLMADIGLVGLPNAGKSTLLSRISAARPKIADYPFTTVEPHLGVMASPSDDFHTLVVADIPGLIEGAHGGAGLGIQFLRHIERCRALAHLVDLSAPEEIGPRVATIRDELASYSHHLNSRPWALIGTKIDVVADREEALENLAETARAHDVDWCAISAVANQGINRLAGLFFEIYDDLGDDQ